MNRLLLLQNYGFSHFVLTKNLEGITHAESLVPPPHGGNCLNWVLGHILASRNRIHGFLGEAPVLDEADAKTYARGSALTEPTRALALERMVDLLNRSQAAITARIEKITDEDFVQPAAHVLSGQPSNVGMQLAALQFHETYHAGQIGILRRVSGKAGALA